MPIYEIVGAKADFCEVYNLLDYEQQKEIGYYEMQFAHEDDFSNSVKISEPM